MMRKRYLALSLLLAAMVPVLLLGAGSSRADGDDDRSNGAVRFLKGVPVPGSDLNTTSPGKMLVFDISWIDEATQLYYLADRSNAVIDVVNAKTGTIVNEVSTGGADGNRADELAFDPVDNLVMPVNNADDKPFATLIKVDPNTGMLTQPKNLEGVDRITFTDATNGAEQPVWDPGTRRFYISIPEIGGGGGKGPNGAVKRINQHTATVEATFVVQFCQPAGLTVGPHGDLLVGCSVIFNEAGTAWTGLTDPSTAAPIQVIIDAKTGEIDKMVAGVGGSDEVWFNRGDGRYYTASRANPGAVPNGSNPPTDPVLGVIDAESKTLVQLVPTFNTPNPTSPPPRGTAHSVAVNAHNNHVFVPLPANNVFPGCQTGCIAVFGVPRYDED